MSRGEYRDVPLPEQVTVSVAELTKLREEAALLAAMRLTKVEEWHGYDYAVWFAEHDADIQAIRLGWKKVHEP